MSVKEARRKSEVLSEAECVDLLRRTPPTMLYRYLGKYVDEPSETGKPFHDFMFRYKKKWNEDYPGEEHLYWNNVFERAGISNTYGYKLVGGSKTTLKRDTILRLCYACRMDYYDALEALRCAGMPTLRARNARDAVIISAFCRGVSDPVEVSRMLSANGLAELEPCGVVVPDEVMERGHRKIG